MSDSNDKAPAGGDKPLAGTLVAPEAIKAIPVRHYGRWVAGVVVIALVALLVNAFAGANVNYGAIPDFFFNSSILTGVKNTIVISVTAMAVGAILGIVLAVMRLSKNPVTAWVAWAYVWFFRGTPVYVQLLVWFNLSIVFPVINLGFYKDEMTQFMTPFMAALLGLGLNEAAYMSEIVRAGLQSVDEGQTEASHALGMTQGQTLRRVVLPQAMRVIVPPTGNEVIAMVKDTSLVAYVPVTGELFFQFQAISARTFVVLPVLVAAVIWYLIICSVLMVIQFFVERHFSRGYGSTSKARQRLRDIGVEQGGRIPPGNEAI